MTQTRLLRLAVIPLLLHACLSISPSNAAQTEVVDSAGSPSPPSLNDSIKKEVILRTVPWLLIVTFCLVLLFLFGVWAVHRYARRYRTGPGGRREAPTASRSVWEMHKLPDDYDPEDWDPDETKRP